jgi:23S rRNA pseudouridine2605 synthase
LVTAGGRIAEEALQQFTRGIYHGGEKLQANKARLISSSVAELVLTEGKNREVRRMFESQGITVKRLQRTQVGKIKLGELKPGKWRTLTEPEIKSLLG